ncbi:xanthine dehydrogenase family protein molybdopterin-binding subunit [Bradyrhizobium sp. U87765 SZCCT0131]|uniref:xanthine dehydrogenase family protein molybdopterin-binding subunit n=1 Tax=unclassified Bradyrhizobium TaxID=2631580 RepID=UPI001BA82E48|nr:MULTISPECIES: molybdopterin cofactor-binding domain-containing protein [unclassified Bradyrhizobium]MBR1216592.1 xanthine dehydrogenase family protein molybdopterin-binding subunit [Bradyrhizobium sp. U87765 SZCCT0131]MBR1259652.1 xanthine dehydrogenase family protein molybdopterin-binding subunit [Bradyrhizobium sp. U87765 SZCCT0134]MBR1305793.1 xanthine dehydrogenase family protein molybdopterin-binding subunit [Bradyrhizobium sp. U87765 SZCCT0110]MBR1322160.1 xanthine dehydrogenase family
MNEHIRVPSSPGPVDFSRRSFLVGAGAAGLVLGYAGVPGLTGNAALAAPASFEPSVWYSIGADGLVTVTCGKADMGQHIASTMAQIVAEELGASWKDMRVALASNDPKYNDPVLGAQITGGSWSTMMNFDAMSRAGAAGRMALADAAAGIMGVPVGEVVVRDSAVSHAKSKKSISFADVVKSGKATRTFTPDQLKAIKLKSPDQYTMIGVSVPQLDIPSKTNGSAKYGIDTFVPGMVYGKLVLPPVRYGAKVTAVDDSAAKKVPGFIKAVTVDDKTGTTTGWVVAVANTYQAARKAAEALKVTWDKGPNASVSSDSLLAEAKRLQGLDDSGLFFVKNGDTKAALDGAAKVLEAEYTTNINIHAPMEPMNATAQLQGDIWHLYSGNQFATRTGAIAAGAVGVDPKYVVMHQMWLGGGFGRRLDGDMMVPAIIAAKAVGKPVKVIYAREDDMTMDFSRPLTYQKIKAGLDGDGKLVAMNHDVVSAWPTKRWGIPDFLTPSVDKKGGLDGFTVNGADHFYTVPNHNVRAIINELAQNATPSGQLRSVAPGWTFWAVESMVDELAHAAGKDPAMFRIAMLDGKGDNNGGAQRLRNTLLAAMGLAGYGTKPLPKGEAMGVACVSSQERKTASWTACVAHVAVGSDGEVKVKKLTVATDVGTAVNPDGIRAQVSGAALWGLSLALYEKATLKDGGIEQTNFDSYTPLRMSQVPEVEVNIIANGEPATGVGEPAVTVIAPAIGNAVFNAVGARVRSLPITADAVKAAMKA